MTTTYEVVITRDGVTAVVAPYESRVDAVAAFVEGIRVEVSNQAGSEADGVHCLTMALTLALFDRFTVGFTMHNQPFTATVGAGTVTIRQAIDRKERP